MEKSALRRENLEKRRLQSAEAAKRKSAQIAEKLFTLPCYKNAENIMVYLSAKGEVLTEEITARALSDGKKLSAPVCREDCSMDAVRFLNTCELKEGKYGILSPVGDEAFPPEEIDLIIVPGCAFGRNKHRIGYGKGYYDRFIKKAENAETVGLCFGFNLADNVPFGKFDMPLDIIITENEVVI